MPRVGSEVFAKAVNSLKNVNFYRITHTDDYVPRLPLFSEIRLANPGLEFRINMRCDCTASESNDSWYPESRIFKRESFDDKLLINDEIELMNNLGRFAYYAHISYCLNHDDGDGVGLGLFVKIAEYINEENELELIVYFSARMKSRESWLNKKFKLVDYQLFQAFGLKSKIDEEMSQQFSVAELRIALKINEKLRLLNRGKIKEEFPIKKFNFVGHSIGAAYAVLTSIKWSITLLLTPFDVYTYGMPHIGNKDFSTGISRLVNLNIYRVTHTDDYVPRLPLLAEDTLLHPIFEFWIFTNCDCNRYEEVWLCLGTPVGEVILESRLCNNHYHYLGDRSHIGPYFGYTMGTCSMPLPPKP
ncbi:hypothetical protein G9A89_008947 [Geosiphon pyriformis]|nr:hypothetical protein G9A89_008947 [Geosiphon pyriformis]